MLLFVVFAAEFIEMGLAEMPAQLAPPMSEQETNENVISTAAIKIKAIGINHFILTFESPKS